MKILGFIVLISILLIGISNAQDELSKDGDAIIKYQNYTLEKGKHTKLASLVNLDPGDTVEGDFIKEMMFYDKGQKLIVSHFVSQNLSIIDWSSQNTVADIPLGAGPVNIGVHNDKAIVSMPLADSVAVIDLMNYSILGKIATPGEPNEIRIDKINNRALVASIDSQKCYVVDLNSLQVTHTLDSFYSGIQTFSFITSNNRSDFEYYDYLLSPDGLKALAISFDGGGISVHDINSGDIDTTFSQISSAFAFQISDSGNAFILNNSGTPALYRINLNTMAMDSISLLGHSIFTLCKGMVVDPAGENVILSMGGGMLKVNFNTMTFNQITNNTVFWMAASFDKQFAVGGGYYTQVVDISTGILVGSYTGLSQSKGVVADSSYHFVGVDPLRKEYLHAYSFGTSVNLLGNISTGSTFEADAAYRVAISEDGNKILVANQLSTTASIIDTDSAKTEYLVPGMLTGSFGCAMTSDGKYGLIADYEGFAIHMIHMESGELIASPAVGDRPSIIRIAPGDTLALVTNTRGNTVSFIRLDSANSSNIGNLSVGVIGVSWTNQGIFSDLQIPSTGHFAFLAASFDDEIKVIDMLQQSIAATIPTGDFPSQIAISDNGQFAVCINKNDNNLSFINVQGAFSSILNVANTSNNPTRVTYNPNTDEFVVCNSGSQSVEFFDGQNGNFKSNLGFGPNYTPIQAEVLTNGKMAYLLAASGSNTSSALQVDGINYPLPARPCYMDASKNGNKLAIAMSGPDYVAIYEGDSLTNINSSKIESFSSFNLFPNPTENDLHIELNENSSGKYSIYNDLGQLVLQDRFNDKKTFQISLIELPKGIYTIKIEESNAMGSLRFIKE